MEKSSFINNIKNIFNKIKIEFVSKDKNRIVKCLSNIFVIVVVAIMIKIPFLFINTMLLDFFNSIGLSIGIQNILEFIVELLYIILALLYIYNRLKKLYISNN